MTSTFSSTAVGRSSTLALLSRTTTILLPLTTKSTSGLPIWLKYIIGIVLCAIILIAIAGNILVCVAILTDRKLRKVGNYFLMSLAISDLVVACLVMPFAVANDLLQYWPFGTEFCNIWISLDILSATASILNLCAISIDRYIHMKHVFQYEEWMTTRKCLGFISLIWILSVLISFLPINLGWHERSVSFSENSTTTISNPHSLLSTSTVSPNAQTLSCMLNLSSAYAVISSSISFFLPCIIMVAVYIKMYKLARHHAENIKQTQAFSLANGVRNKVGENKALFTLGMIMGLFLASWIPFFTVNIVSSFCGPCIPASVFIAFTWLGYINSAMNPFIYSKYNADFRAAFKLILCCERFCNRDPYKFKSRSRTSSNMAMKRLPTNGSLENGQNGNAQTRHNGYKTDRLPTSNLVESQSLMITT